MAIDDIASGPAFVPDAAPHPHGTSVAQGTLNALICCSDQNGLCTAPAAAHTIVTDRSAGTGAPARRGISGRPLRLGPVIAVPRREIVQGPSERKPNARSAQSARKAGYLRSPVAE